MHVDNPYSQIPMCWNWLSAAILARSVILVLKFRTRAVWAQGRGDDNECFGLHERKCSGNLFLIVVFGGFLYYEIGWLIDGLNAVLEVYLLVLMSLWGEGCQGSENVRGELGCVL